MNVNINILQFKKSKVALHYTKSASFLLSMVQILLKFVKYVISEADIDVAPAGDG